MADANDSVSEAVEQALSGSEDTQSSDTQNPEATTDPIAEAVRQATKSPSDEKVSTKEKGKDPVPYDRFAEVVAQKNTASEQLKALESKLTETTTREDSLRDQLRALEEEHNILEAIRALGKDDRYSDTVNRIDKALQGIHEEEVRAEESDREVDDEKIKKLSSKFDTEVERLRDEVAEQRVDALLEKSQSYAAALLESLPDAYTDEDRRNLSEMWSPRVDWDTIEEKGSEVIPEILKGSFASLIKDYGTPRGVVKESVRSELTKEHPEASFQSPEDAVKEILGKNWSGVDDKGTPELSDDEFTRDLAKIMKATNQGY